MVCASLTEDCVFQRVEKLNAECENAIKQLKKTINILQATCLPAEAQVSCFLQSVKMSAVTR